VLSNFVLAQKCVCDSIVKSRCDKTKLELYFLVLQKIPIFGTHNQPASLDSPMLTVEQLLELVQSPSQGITKGMAAEARSFSNTSDFF
jgi:hypothetical protein